MFSPALGSWPGTIRSIAEFAKRARSLIDATRSAGVFFSSTMKAASVSVAPMAFSHAMTASGKDSLRASIPFPMTGAMNLRMLGPTAHVTWVKV